MTLSWNYISYTTVHTYQWKMYLREGTLWPQLFACVLFPLLAATAICFFFFWESKGRPGFSVMLVGSYCRSKISHFYRLRSIISLTYLEYISSTSHCNGSWTKNYENQYNLQYYNHCSIIRNLVEGSFSGFPCPSIKLKCPVQDYI